MQTIENAVMIVAMVEKSVANEVASQLYTMTDSKISIFYGSGQSNEKGFLGITLNDEVVEIVCAVDQPEVDSIVKTISEIGRLDELGKGSIMIVPSVTMMIPSPKSENP